MDVSSFFSLIQNMIIFALVIALSYFSIRLANKFIAKSNGIIKIIEKAPLSNNSMLGVADICGTYYLMSFSGGDNKILKELDREKVEAVINKEKAKPVELKNTLANYFGMRGKVD